MLGEIELNQAPVEAKKKNKGQANQNLQQDTNALDDNFKKSIAKAN